MNRTLKFRVWNGVEWVGSDEFTLFDIANKDTQLKGYVVQQFTGMLDKNGKEIYEGDIVKTIYEEMPIAVVQYAFEFCSYRLLTIDNKSFALRTFRYENEKPIGLVDVIEEVIGNIFENENLL
jgi:uncharacterized phage protein (TIGR01671 family)